MSAALIDTTHWDFHLRSYAFSEEVAMRIASYREETFPAPARELHHKPHVERADFRILLYGHDTFGLGHLRRNLAIATQITNTFSNVSVLLITGSSSAYSFRVPERVDFLKLPTVVKVADEEYAAQTLRLTPTEIIGLRAALIREAAIGFAPDLVVIDHAPMGMKGEALSALTALRSIRPHAQIVLGLRDIIDEPERVREVWQRQGVYDLLATLYDAIFVYGTPSILDVEDAYQLPAQIASKLRYCGYLRRVHPSTTSHHLRASLCSVGEQLAVVMAGGGGDGYPLLRTYLQGIQSGAINQQVTSVLVTGPLMGTREREDLAQLSAECPSTRLIEFTDDPLGLIEAADVVISMGGYNTLCEILSVGTPALVIPRVVPRREQLMRAQAFARLGLVAALPQDEMTPETLAKQVNTLLSQARTSLVSPLTQAIRRFQASGAFDGLDEMMRQIELALRQTDLMGVPLRRELHADQ